MIQEFLSLHLHLHRVVQKYKLTVYVYIQFHLGLSSFNDCLQARRKLLQHCLQQCSVREVVLFKPIKKRRWCCVKIRPLDYNNALKIWMDSAWLDVSTNGNVCIQARTILCINTMKTPIEEIVEAFMNGVSLVQNNCMTFRC